MVLHVWIGRNVDFIQPNYLVSQEARIATVFGKIYYKHVGILYARMPYKIEQPY